MLARTVPKDAITIPHRKNYFLRWTLIIGGTLLAIVLAGVVFVGAWAVHALHRFELLRREIRSSYQALNAEYPFSPPAATSAIPTQRFDAYLRIHNALMDSISPSEE